MSSDSEDLHYLSTVFKVLSDPTRLKLFNIILGGVHCNCELVSQTGLSNNLISHHMHVLINAGLIQSERKPDDARWILYSVNRDKLNELQRILAVFISADALPEREPICPPCK